MKPSLALAFLLTFTANSVWADAPQHDENNRYTGGKKIILNLSREQIQFLNAQKVHWTELKIKDPFERWQSILLRLDPTQTALIRAEAGIAPSRLDVWDTRKGGWDCTCQSANLAFRFSETQIEVPHEWLMSDEKANRVWEGFARQFH